MKYYRLLDKEIEEMLDEKEIVIDYIKVTCNKCGASWGITITPDYQISKKNITCRVCLLNEYMGE